VVIAALASYAIAYRFYARFIVRHVLQVDNSRATPAERLDNGYRDFAEDRANIDHVPSTYLKRLYYDTVTFSPHVLRLLRDWVGADHMAMGSDYPHKLGDIDRAVTTVDELDVSGLEREQIFSGTARAIINNS